MSTIKETYPGPGGAKIFFFIGTRTNAYLREIVQSLPGDFPNTAINRVSAFRFNEDIENVEAIKLAMGLTFLEKRLGKEYKRIQKNDTTIEKLIKFVNLNFDFVEFFLKYMCRLYYDVLPE